MTFLRTALVPFVAIALTLTTDSLVGATPTQDPPSKRTPEQEAREQRLFKIFGKDKPQAMAAIEAVWQKLLKIAKTRDYKAFYKLLTSPVRFTLGHTRPDAF